MQGFQLPWNGAISICLKCNLRALVAISKQQFRGGILYTNVYLTALIFTDMKKAKLLRYFAIVGLLLTIVAAFVQPWNNATSIVVVLISTLLVIVPSFQSGHIKFK